MTRTASVVALWNLHCMDGLLIHPTKHSLAGHCTTTTTADDGDVLFLRP